MRTSVALFLAGFATFSLIYCTQPLLPEFSSEFGVDPAASSLALSLTTGCLAISIFCVGAMSEIWGRRGLMFFSMTCAAILNLVCATATSWEFLLVIRSLEGFALGGVPAVAMAYLSEEVPAESLSRAMGLYVGGTALGGMIGRVAIGSLTHLLSWRIALATMAVTDLVVAVGFVLLLPPSRNFVRRKTSSLRVHLDAWREHLSKPDMRWLFATGFLSMGAFVTIYNYAGYRLLAPPYNLNQTQVGLIFLVYIFGTLTSPVAGIFADRFGRSPVVMAGSSIMMLGLICTMAEPLWAVIFGIVVMTVGFFFVHPVASGWVAFLAKRDRSHAASLYLLSFYVGSSILGSLGGWFWHVAGWAGVIGFCSVLTLTVLGIALHLRNHPAKV